MLPSQPLLSVYGLTSSEAASFSRQGKVTTTNVQRHSLMDLLQKLMEKLGSSQKSLEASNCDFASKHDSGILNYAEGIPRRQLLSDPSSKLMQMLMLCPLPEDDNLAWAETNLELLGPPAKHSIQGSGDENTTAKNGICKSYYSRLFPSQHTINGDTSNQVTTTASENSTSEGEFSRLATNEEAGDEYDEACSKERMITRADEERFASLDAHNFSSTCGMPDSSSSASLFQDYDGSNLGLQNSISMLVQTFKYYHETMMEKMTTVSANEATEAAAIEAAAGAIASAAGAIGAAAGVIGNAAESVESASLGTKYQQNVKKLQVSSMQNYEIERGVMPPLLDGLQDFCHTNRWNCLPNIESMELLGHDGTEADEAIQDHKLDLHDSSDPMKSNFLNSINKTETEVQGDTIFATDGKHISPDRNAQIDVDKGVTCLKHPGVPRETSRNKGEEDSPSSDDCIVFSALSSPPILFHPMLEYSSLNSKEEEMDLPPLNFSPMKELLRYIPSGENPALKRSCPYGLREKPKKKILNSVYEENHDSDEATVQYSREEEALFTR